MKEIIPTVKRSAVRWVADMVYETNGYEDVQILRIEDLSVAAALGLPKHRKGLKYTMAELAEVGGELDRLLQEAQENQVVLEKINGILALSPDLGSEDIAKRLGMEIERVEELQKLDPEKPYTSLQVRLREVKGKLNKIFGLRKAMQNSYMREGDVVQGLYLSLIHI